MGHGKARVLGSLVDRVRTEEGRGGEKEVVVLPVGLDVLDGPDNVLADPLDPGTGIEVVYCGTLNLLGETANCEEAHDGARHGRLG